MVAQVRQGSEDDYEETAVLACVFDDARRDGSCHAGRCAITTTRCAHCTRCTGAGLKTTFCLIDLDFSDSVHEHKTKVYWDCDADLQGISVGYGDPYHHALEGQEIEITGLPAGIYYLTFDVDPDQHWLETDDTNNRAWAKFRLDRKGANPSVTVLEEYGYEGNTSNK